MSAAWPAARLFCLSAPSGKQQRASSAFEMGHLAFPQLQSWSSFRLFVLGQGQRRRTVAHRASWNSLRRRVLLGWVCSRLFWEAAVQGLGTAAPGLHCSTNTRGWAGEGCQTNSSTVLTCAQQPGLKWPARQVSGSFQSLECPQMPAHVVLPNSHRPPSSIQRGQSLLPNLCRPTRK